MMKEENAIVEDNLGVNISDEIIAPITYTGKWTIFKIFF